MEGLGLGLGHKLDQPNSGSPDLSFDLKTSVEFQGQLIWIKFIFLLFYQLNFFKAKLDFGPLLSTMSPGFSMTQQLQWDLLNPSLIGFIYGFMLKIKLSFETSDELGNWVEY